MRDEPRGANDLPQPISRMLARQVVRHAGWTLAFTLLLTCYFASGLSYRETRPLLDGELPSTNLLVRNAERFAETHPDRNYVAIGIESVGPNGVWNPGTLQKIIDLSERAGALPGVVGNVQSLATWDHVVGTEESVEITSLMPHVPTDPAALALLREIVSKDPLLTGRLVAADGQMALVRVAFAGDAEQSTIHAGLESLRAEFKGPERIAIFGRAHLDQEIDIAIESHLRFLLPCAVCLLLALFWMSFGRFQAIWMTAGLVTILVVSFVGLTGLLEIPETVLSSVIPILLVVVTGSYNVHLLARIYDEAEQLPWTSAIETALVSTGRPIALSAVTTSLGFATLGSFEIVSIQEFGVLSSLAVLGSGILTLASLPAALVVAGRPAPASRFGRQHFLNLVHVITDYCAYSTLSKSRVALIALTSLFGCAFVGSFAMRVGSNPAEYFPDDHSVRSDFEAMVSHFGADGFLFIQIISPPDRDILAPAFLARVEALQADIRQEPHVAFASSITDTVLARLHRVLNGDDPQYERLPESRAAAAQILEFYRWDAAETLKEMIDPSDPPRYLVVDVFAELNDSAETEELVTRLNTSIMRHFPTPSAGSVLLGGDAVTWSAQNHYIVRGKLMSVVAATAMVGLFCWFVFGSIRMAILAVLPTSLSVLSVFGAMGFLGIRLDLSSCVITSIVVGIGVDFAVHYLFRLKEQFDRDEGINRRSAAGQAVGCAAPPILYDVGSNIVAFSVFLFSPLMPIRNFGILICVSQLAAGLATLGVLPRLAGWTRSAKPLRSSKTKTSKAPPLRSQPPAA